MYVSGAVQQQIERLKTACGQKRLPSLNVVVNKAQLISKEILVSSILPNNEKENFSFCPSLLGQIFFILFLEGLKKQKSSFETN